MSEMIQLGRSRRERVARTSRRPAEPASARALLLLGSRLLIWPALRLRLLGTASQAPKHELANCSDVLTSSVSCLVAEARPRNTGTAFGKSREVDIRDFFSPRYLVHSAPKLSWLISAGSHSPIVPHTRSESEGILGAIASPLSDLTPTPRPEAGLGLAGTSMCPYRACSCPSALTRRVRSRPTGGRWVMPRVLRPALHEAGA
jgi:hypothetical protein